MTGNPSLRWLLGWVHRRYFEETPELQHALTRMDEGGAPAMRTGIAMYLGLDGSRSVRRDDALDRETGVYRTPLRAAMARIRDHELRTFLRDLAPNALNPSVVAEVHGLPKWAEPHVMHQALLALWREYRDQPLAPDRGWVTISEAQRNSVIAGEAA